MVKIFFVSLTLKLPDISISISGEVDAAITSFLKGTTGEAIILSCDKKTMTLTITDHLQESDPKEVAEELPEASPRFVLHRLKIGPDGEAQNYKPFFILYNPLSCSVDLKRLFTSAKADLLSRYSDLKKFVKEFELNNSADFTFVGYKTKLYGLTGTEGKPLPGQKSTGGYDGRL